MTRIITKKELLKIVSLSYVTIWRLEKAGTFPARRKLSCNRVGWLSSEVEEWMRAREVAV